MDVFKWSANISSKAIAQSLDAAIVADLSRMAIAKSATGG